MTLADQRQAFLDDIGRERDDVRNWCRYAMAAVAAVGLACALAAGDGRVVAGVVGAAFCALGGQQRRLSTAWRRHNSFAARARAATLAELDAIAAEYGRHAEGPLWRLLKRYAARGSRRQPVPGGTQGVDDDVVKPVCSWRKVAAVTVCATAVSDPGPAAPGRARSGG